MIVLILLVILAVACFAPSFWAKRVLRLHAQDRPDIPGTGGEFARHLLDIAHLEQIGVETTDQGDHYDPTEKMVRLSHQNYAGRSLTAIAVAAHEVGHALQDRDGYQPLRIRSVYARYAGYFEQVARGILVLSPMMIAVSPKLAMLQLVLGLLVMMGQVAFHAITLPVEFDASFARALPILKGGGYVHEEDMDKATSILRACAWTYVAAALMSVINVARWLRFGR